MSGTISDKPVILSPITCHADCSPEVYQEVSTTDGKTYVTQYFERARFEQHPDKAGTPFEVLQGLLGRELIKLLGAG